MTRLAQPVNGDDPRVLYLLSHPDYGESRATGERAYEEAVTSLRRLADRMGLVGGDTPVIHIAGTNGKSSTARMAAALCRSEGHRVGLFTSPHFHSLTDRIVIDGSPITDDWLHAGVDALRDAERATREQPTFFEALLLIALWAFRQARVDCMVVETGIGGLYDPTTVLVDADVAVVTTIGRDHVELLGPELLDIARHKAGIIKPTSVAIVGPIDPLLTAEFTARPARRVLRRGTDFGCFGRDEDGSEAVTLWVGPHEYTDLILLAPGRHQGENASAALAAVHELIGGVTRASVEQSFRDTMIAGRLEVVREHPTVLVDGAHNRSAAEAVRRFLASPTFRGRPLEVVVGMLEGHEPADFLEGLLGILGEITVCAANHPRAASAADLRVAASRAGLTCGMGGGVAAAVANAARHVGPTGVVVACGSFAVAREAKIWALSEGLTEVQS